MLWTLLDRRAYTAGELATSTGISPTSASNHLAKLLAADIIKVESQGRHRYFSFARPEVAYVIESLATLANNKTGNKQKKIIASGGITYCRTCYDHLAGYVAVSIVDALERKHYIRKNQSLYAVTPKGWEWFAQFGIDKDAFTNNRRPLARQCLDWSERRPHIAGQLGAALLESMLDKKWFRKVQFSREMIVTAKGKDELYKTLGIDLSLR
ncbi:transcriptional regulator, ArsR family [Ostertagia ostertagi]